MVRDRPMLFRQTKLHHTLVPMFLNRVPGYKDRTHRNGGLKVSIPPNILYN